MLILKNFDILTDFTSNPSLKNSSLLVEDGRIAEIQEGENGFQEEVSSAEKVIEGDGKLLMPGLVNSHTHLGMTIFRGFAEDLPLRKWLEDWIWPAEDLLTEEEVYWGAKLGMAELIRSGVTSFADMYFFMDAVARGVEEAGLRANLSYGLIAEKLDEEGKKEVQKGLQLIDDWHGKAGGRIKVGLSPHAPYTCGDEVWKKILKEAEKRKVLIHTHIAETKKDVEESLEKYGLTPVKRLNRMGVLDQSVLVAHCVHLDEKEMEIIAEKQIYPAFCPSSNMKLSSGIAPTEALANMGVTEGLGTDGPSSNNDLDMFEEMRLIGFKQKFSTNDPTSMPAPEILKLATENGARATGMENTGRIEIGKKADLIAIDRKKPHWKPTYDVCSNLIYSAKSTDVELVMVDGNLLMEEGELKTLDEDRIIDRMEKIASKYAEVRKDLNKQ